MASPPWSGCPCGLFRTGIQHEPSPALCRRAPRGCPSAGAGQVRGSGRLGCDTIKGAVPAHGTPGATRGRQSLGAHRDPSTSRGRCAVAQGRGCLLCCEAGRVPSQGLSRMSQPNHTQSPLNLKLEPYGERHHCSPSFPKEAKSSLYLRTWAQTGRGTSSPAKPPSHSFPRHLLH